MPEPGDEFLAQGAETRSVLEERALDVAMWLLQLGVRVYFPTREWYYETWDKMDRWADSRIEKMQKRIAELETEVKDIPEA